MNFSELNLPEPVVKAASALGYTEPTAIQQKAIPLILGGQDIIAHSQTGSGKTAAFGLPLVSRVPHGKGIHALILTPTRELCVQVSDALRGFARNLPLRITAVFGGVGIGAQLQAVRSADIVVATPGRLLDLVTRGMKLHTVQHLVLDEADRMLDMGFIRDVEKIISLTSKERQTLLFSATLSPKLRSLVNKYMNSPVAIQTKVHVDTSLLTEEALFVSPQDKFSLLAHLLKQDKNAISIVFCATRRGCDKIAKQLRLQNIDSTPIHGGLTQSKRLHVIAQLHKRGVGVLVATDVASRGIHIDNISHVYNYDLPQTPDDYVHRIGRTARAGAEGKAVIFVTPQDKHDFNSIQRSINRTIPQSNLPEFERVASPKVPEREEHRFRKGAYFRKGPRRFGGAPREGQGGRFENRGKFSGQKSESFGRFEGTERPSHARPGQSRTGHGKPAHRPQKRFFRHSH